MKKANNTGSVTFDKSTNKWLARFPSPITGKRIAKRFSSRTDAERWLSEQMVETAKGTFIEPSRMTLGDWSIEYMVTYAKPKVRARTYETYKGTLEKLQPLSGVPLQKLTPTIVQKFLNDLEASDNAKLKVYRLLSVIIKKAVALGMLARNIMDVVETPKYKPEEIETFTQEEIEQLLKSVKTSKYYSKYYPVILLGFSSGCRIGEILGLKISNVFDDHIFVDNALHQIKSRTFDDLPKSDAGTRKVTLPAMVVGELRKAYLNPLTNCGYVFHTSTNKPISISNMEKVWRKILQEAKLPHKHFHALRHTHATELLGKGIPILEVSHRLGHSKPSTTLNYYGHAIKGYDDKIAELVGTMVL